ncbi:MAG: tetratricopeptide repeat protein [Vicinamibacterales bacterium]
MKAGERHHLKTNEFAVRLARGTEMVATHRDRVLMGAAAVALLVVAIAGYSWYRGNTTDKAEALLGAAMTTYEAPIVPAPTIPGTVQQVGTYPTETARSEAALAGFQKIIDSYPSTTAAVAARYHRACALMALRRLGEAEQAFQGAAAAAGSTVFGPMSKMGQASVLAAGGQFDKALPMFEALAADRDGMLPVDGVLMQLGRAYAQAGKRGEAKTAYKRVVDEFPESNYVGQARQELVKLG